MKHTKIEGDCLEVMRDLPRGHFDLLIADPPYAMPATYYQGAAARKRWSDSSIMQGWWRSFLASALPVMKDSSSVCVFCNGGAVAAFWPSMYEAMRHIQLAVWDKGMLGRGYPFRIQTEFIIIGVNGDPRRWAGGAPNVLRYPRVPLKARQHPAQKPRELLADLARQLCPDGGRVLDPFAGSFSTEAACDSLGLECTSI